MPKISVIEISCDNGKSISCLEVDPCEGCTDQRSAALMARARELGWGNWELDTTGATMKLRPLR